MLYRPNLRNGSVMGRQTLAPREVENRAWTNTYTTAVRSNWDSNVAVESEVLK